MLSRTASQTFSKNDVKLPTCFLCEKNVSTEEFTKKLLDYHAQLNQFQELMSNCDKLRRSTPWAPQLPVRSALDARAKAFAEFRQNPPLPPSDPDPHVAILKKNIVALEEKISLTTKRIACLREERKDIVREANTGRKFGLIENLEIVDKFEKVSERIHIATNQQKILECKKDDLSKALGYYQVK